MIVDKNNKWNFHILYSFYFSIRLSIYSITKNTIFIDLSIQNNGNKKVKKDKNIRNAN